MILILTEGFDPHAGHVAQKLRQRGAAFSRFNPAAFPSKAEISLAHTPGGEVRGILRAGGEAVDLSRLTAVWYRRPRPPVPHEEITDEPIRVYLEEECNAFMYDVCNWLDCLMLPASPSVIRRAGFKASQLRAARALGFDVPPTLFTNSPDDLLDFYRQQGGNIVSKLVGTSFHTSPVSEAFNRYTEVVSKRDVGYAGAVRFCPVIFQAYVPKRVELRVTVVGAEVFAAEIHSQASNHTRHDWRRYDFHKTPYFPHELPREVKLRCVRLVERLGLCYGAIDLVLTPDGRYVFLEINPNGQYLWIENATGLPISDAICDLLMAGLPATNPTQHSFELCSGGSR
jgi:hypothetical protein